MDIIIGIGQETHVCVENGKNNVRDDTNRRVAGVQLVEEALVPCIHAVLQHAFNHLEKTLLANTIFRKVESQLGYEFFRLLRVDEDVASRWWNVSG